MQVRLIHKVRSKLYEDKLEDVTLIKGDIWLLIMYLISNGEIQVPSKLDLHLYVDDVEIPKPEEMEDDT